MRIKSYHNKLKHKGGININSVIGWWVMKTEWVDERHYFWSSFSMCFDVLCWRIFFLFCVTNWQCSQEHCMCIRADRVKYCQTSHRVVFAYLCCRDRKVRGILQLASPKLPSLPGQPIINLTIPHSSHQ